MRVGRTDLNSAAFTFLLDASVLPEALFCQGLHGAGCSDVVSSAFIVQAAVHLCQASSFLIIYWLF